MSEFDVVLGMDWLMAHRVVIGCDCRIQPTHWMVIVLCFRGISMTLYPELSMTLSGTGIGLSG